MGVGAEGSRSLERRPDCHAQRHAHALPLQEERRKRDLRRQRFRRSLLLGIEGHVERHVQGPAALAIRRRPERRKGIHPQRTAGLPRPWRFGLGLQLT